MAYNGTGTFNRIYNWTTDAANGINIEAARMDTEDSGFATGLSNAITKDGQTTITANIPFNSKKITGLANGSARTDSIALGQVQDGTYKTLGTLGGSADTYTATPTPAITAYATGSEFNLKVNADNTGASTLNVSAIDPKDIKKYDGAGSKVDLEAGDLQQDQYYKVIYDGTDFVVLNTAFLLPSGQASETLSGVAEIATQAEVNAGTDDSRIVTPLKLKNLPGHIVQVVNTQTGVTAAGGGNIPFDNSPPQNTEGTEFMILSITPTNTNNKLQIDIVFNYGQSSVTVETVALFQDSVASALGGACNQFLTGEIIDTISFSHSMIASTTSPTTFKVRAGGIVGTTQFNGQFSGQPRLGGVMASSITITEIQV